MKVNTGSLVKLTILAASLVASSAVILAIGYTFQTSGMTTGKPQIGVPGDSGPAPVPKASIVTRQITDRTVGRKSGTFSYDPKRMTVREASGIEYNLSEPMITVNDERTLAFVVSDGTGIYNLSGPSKHYTSYSGDNFTFLSEKEASGMGLRQVVSFDTKSMKMKNSVENNRPNPASNLTYYYVIGLKEDDSIEVKNYTCDYTGDCRYRDGPSRDDAVSFNGEYEFNFADLTSNGFTWSDTRFADGSLWLGFRDGSTIYPGESIELDPTLLPTVNNVTGTSMAVITDQIFAVGWFEIGTTSDSFSAAAYYTNGTQIGNKLVLDYDTRVAPDSLSTRACSLNATDFVLAWFDHDSGKYRASTINFNGTGIHNVTNFPFGSDYTRTLGVGCLNETHFVLGWETKSSGVAYYQICDYLGNCDSQVSIDTGLGDNLEHGITDIVELNSTRFVIMYSDQTNTNLDFYIFETNGNGIMNSALDSDFDVTSSPGPGASLAALNDTYWVACWSSRDYGDVYCQVRNSTGSVVTPEFDVDVYASQARSVTVAALNDHEFVVAYNDQTDSMQMFAIYDVNGKEIMPPTAAGESNYYAKSYLSSVASYEQNRGVGICDGNFIMVKRSSSAGLAGLPNAYWEGYYGTGTIWDGVCEPACNPDTWYNYTWYLRKAITINSSKLDSDLNNFPVLVSVTDPDLASNAQEDGSDILFTECSSTIKLPHEMEDYDSATGALTAWVNVRNVSAESDSTIYMYFKNTTDIASQDESGDTWDSYYMAVQHFKDDPSTPGYSILDSTSHQEDMKINFTSSGMNSSNRVSGKIAYSIYFDGDDDDISTSDFSPPDPYYLQHLMGTYEFWIKDDESDCESGGTSCEIFWKANTGNSEGIRVWPGANNDELVVYEQNDGSTITTNITALDGNWHQVVIVYDNRSHEVFGHMKVYVDGAIAAIDNNVVSDLTTRSAGFEFGINGEFKGTIDEFRYSNWTERTENFIKANFNTMSDPSSFLTFGYTESLSTPSIIVNSPTNKTYYDGVTVFNVTAEDDEYSVSACLYSLDGGTTKTAMVNSAGNYWTATNTSMTNKTHTVTFYCNNTLGNWNDTENMTFTMMDAKPPWVTGVGISSTSGYNFTTDNITLSYASGSDGEPITNITDWRLNGSSIAVLNMPFDTNVSGNGGEVRDYSTFKSNGTLNDNAGTGAPTWTSDGAAGGAYYFDDAAGDYIIATGWQKPSNATFSGFAWIKPVSRGATSEEMNIMGRSFATWELQNEYNDELMVKYNASAGCYISSTNANIQLNEWSHVGFVVNGTDILYYKNGTYVGGGVIPADCNVTQPDDFWIGARLGPAQEFNGTIDEVIVFNRALTPEQIMVLYEAGLQGHSPETMSSDETSTGDNWTVAVTPNNATQDGATVLSIPLYISDDVYIPQIAWKPPTPYTGYSTNADDVYLNATITADCEASAWFDLDGSLVGYWAMDYHNSTGIFDNSSHGNDGVYVSLSESDVATGARGDAMYFGGSSSINLSNPSDLNFGNYTDFTLSAWVKPDSSGLGDEGVIVSKYQSGSAAAFMMSVYEDALRAWINDGTGFVIAQGTTNITQNGWHHVAATFDRNGNITIYADGVVEDTQDISGKTDSISNAYNAYIGRRDYVSGPSHFDGTIDEVIIFNRSLSADEVKALYNATANGLSANFTDLYEGTHGYSAYGMGCYGDLNITSTRYVTTGNDTIPPQITWKPPTPENGSTIYDRSVEMNISITEHNELGEAIYNWNGTNYTLYDGSLVLMMNFEKLGSLGENSTHIVDMSMYGNNGTAEGTAAWTALGKYGAAYDFNGGEGADVGNITVPDDDSLDGMDEITITAWVKLHSRKDWSRIVAKKIHDAGTAVDDSYMLLLDGSDETAYMRIYPSSGTNPQTGYSSSIVPLEKWTFIAGTYNGTRLTIYFNGVAENYTDETAGAINQSTTPLFIGNDGDTNQAINASIDEVRVYNRSLSAEEIQQLYFTNLYRYGPDDWVLYANQSKNSTGGLDYGNYTTRAFVTDDHGNLGASGVIQFTLEDKYGNQSCTSWYSQFWRYRKNITINHSLVDDDLYGFPVAVNITDPDLIGEVDANASGILFTTAGGCDKLPHEVEYYNATLGWLVAWVRVPNISSAQDTKVLMYYNTTAPGSQEDPEAVWDDNYTMVHHLEEDPTCAGVCVLDSTKYNISADPSSISSNDWVTALFGHGIDFDDDADWMSVANNPGINPNDELTLEFWARDDGGPSWRTVMQKTAFGTYGWRIMNGGTYFGDIYSTSGSIYFRTSKDAFDGDWHHVVLALDTGDIRIYRDGEQIQTVSSYDHTGLSGSAMLRIGGYTGGSANYSGTFDEIRFSNISRSDAWIKAEYRSQNSSLGFYTLGSEQQYPANYTLQITDPTTAHPDSTDGGMNVTSTFYFNAEGTNITSDLTINDVFVGGTWAQINNITAYLPYFSENETASEGYSTGGCSAYESGGHQEDGTYIRTLSTDGSAWRIGYYNGADSCVVNIMGDVGINFSTLGINGSMITNITVGIVSCWDGEEGVPSGACDNEEPDPPEFYQDSNGTFTVYINGTDLETLDCTSAQCEADESVLLGDIDTSPLWGNAYDDNLFTYQKLSGFTDGDLDENNIMWLLLETNGTNYGASGGYEVMQGIDSITLNVSYRIADVTYQASYISGVGWQVNFTAPDLSDGYKDLYINATYNGYTVNDTEISALYYEDLTQPSVAIVSPLSQTYNLTQTVVFNVSATDETMMDTCVYSLDGAANSSTSNSTIHWSGTNTTMTEGSHQVIFYCNDTNGNYRSSGPRSFAIDLAPRVTWTDPTPSDTEAIPTDYVDLNATVTDTSGTAAFFDWNRTLLMYLPFEDVLLDGTVFDNSTYGNDGLAMLHDTNTTVSGKFGSAFEFDGTEDYVNVSHDASFETENGTVMFWVKLNDLSQNPMFSKDLSGCTGDCGHLTIGYGITYVIPACSNQICLRLQDDGNGGHYALESDDAIESISAGTWYHVAFTFGSLGMHLYVNGQEHDSNVSQTKGISNNQLPLRIGAMYDLTSYLNGTVDDVAFFGRQLSATEINASYDNSVHRLEANMTGLAQGASYTYSAYVNDEGGNLRITPDRTFSYISNSCPYNGTGDWMINGTDNCTITWNVDVGGNDIHITGYGTFVTTANITNYGRIHLEGEDPTNILRVVCKDGGCFR